MTLKKWIASRGGGAAVSRLLGVSESTVSRWLSDGRIPRVGTMLKIVKHSRGKVRVYDIVVESSLNKKRVRR